jgi:hypothetical protein
MKKDSLLGLLDKTGADAAGADLHAFHGVRFFIHTAYFLQIGEPYFFGFIIGMAYFIAHDRLLTAYFTNSGHETTPWQ